MSKHAFEVKPLRHYDGAHYPSPHFEPTGLEPVLEAEQPGCSPLQFLAILVLLLGLALGMLACFGAEDFPTDNPDNPDNPGGPGGPDGPDPECDPGDIVCDALGNVSFCDADGQAWTTANCNEYCVETRGQDYWSMGCNTAAEDPCLCEYGMIDGEWVECEPGDVMCSDETTVATCDDYYWEHHDCDEICVQTYGAGAFAVGCDAAEENPCLCDFDIAPGVVAECTPGDVFCSDDTHYMICEDDRTTWTPMDCEDYCNETGGIDAYAIGCDATQVGQPCLCEYDIIDGDIAACTPGEVWCRSDDIAGICHDNQWDWDYVYCDDYCPENYGPDSYSDGCDASNPENFCGCYGVVDGEPVDP